MTQLARRPTDRRQPLLKKEPPMCAHFAEVAGGTTAECAAVCCCCPCGLVNLLVLTVVRLPAGLCRKALKKKKKRRVAGKKKMALLHERKREDTRLSQVHPAPPDSAAAPGACLDQLPKADTCLDQLPKAEAFLDELPKTEASPIDDEEWVKLYTGFWRNPSERE
ncbi:uncharacterized protein LOC116256088 [Nymphaea colorata]|uniref:uncharacterized protein LOC116256088 n=1 Tax=Nymphaea colorata TaxID=210225 RepID=UPI00129E40B5|nr:uncharacterized protein LOC116256088 [Nymphaea colorata]